LLGSSNWHLGEVHFCCEFTVTYISWFALFQSTCQDCE